MKTMNNADNSFVDALENYKAGDNEAFNYIYECSSDKLKKYALYLTENTVDAEDLLQDTYLRILEKSGTVRDNLAFMAWARTIMYNIFISKCRKSVKEFSCEDDKLNALLDETHSTEDPLTLIERSEIDNTVNRAVISLNDKQQEVIRDYYYNEKPVKLIALQTATTENTVKTRLFYARKTLKKQLEQEMAM